MTAAGAPNHNFLNHSARQVLCHLGLHYSMPAAFGSAAAGAAAALLAETH